MLPGSHQGHIGDPNNILPCGKRIEAKIDKSWSVWTTRRPREASLHEVYMWNASRLNETADHRVSLSLHYITVEARQEWIETDFATLVCGEDHFGHFQSEAMPQATRHLDAAAD